jgi:hypothetical protein
MRRQAWACSASPNRSNRAAFSAAAAIALIIVRPTPVGGMGSWLDRSGVAA